MLILMFSRHFSIYYGYCYMNTKKINKIGFVKNWCWLLFFFLVIPDCLEKRIVLLSYQDETDFNVMRDLDGDRRTSVVKRLQYSCDVCNN